MPITLLSENEAECFDIEFLLTNTQLLKYSKHDRDIPFRTAYEMADSLLIKHPEWYLAGSLALMISGEIRRGQVSDIDFASNNHPWTSTFRRNSITGMFASNGLPQMAMAYYPQYPGTPYYHYKYGDRIDLFVHKKPIRCQLTAFDCLRLQNIDDVLKWKQIFNREKDKLDLSAINLEDSLFEI